jgi:hypothetical protein
VSSSAAAESKHNIAFDIGLLAFGQLELMPFCTNFGAPSRHVPVSTDWLGLEGIDITAVLAALLLELVESSSAAT